MNSGLCLSKTVWKEWSLGVEREKECRQLGCAKSELATLKGRTKVQKQKQKRGEGEAGV